MPESSDPRDPRRNSSSKSPPLHAETRGGGFFSEEFDEKKLMAELRDLPRFLLAFLRRPIETMREIPIWSWPAQLTVQVGTAMISGVLVGLLGRNFWDLLLGLLILPLSSLAASATLALVYTTFFGIFLHTHLKFKDMHGVVVLAYFPFLLLHILAGFLPPIDLIGFACTCMLLIVGLTDHFRLSKKPVIRLGIATYAAFFAIWSVGQIRGHLKSSNEANIPAPQTLDKMEKDVRNHD